MSSIILGIVCLVAIATLLVLAACKVARGVSTSLQVFRPEEYEEYGLDDFDPPLQHPSEYTDFR